MQKPQWTQERRIFSSACGMRIGELLGGEMGLHASDPRVHAPAVEHAVGVEGRLDAARQRARAPAAAARRRRPRRARRPARARASRGRRAAPARRARPRRRPASARSRARRGRRRNRRDASARARPEPREESTARDGLTPTRQTARSRGSARNSASRTARHRRCEIFALQHALGAEVGEQREQLARRDSRPRRRSPRRAGTCARIRAPCRATASPRR